MAYSKEATTPLTKNSVWATGVDIPLWEIAFLRVKEMKLRTQTEFGRNR